MFREQETIVHWETINNPDKGGNLMRSDTEAHLALYRLAHELNSASVVKAVHGLMVGSAMHVWVVLRERTREARYDVYAAQLKVDPDFLLTLHFADSANAVPADAEAVATTVV